MKSKTHVYLANLIMEDLAKGSLELKGFGKYQIPEEIRQAIINNGDYFRAGAVGPDFYPDMIVGQTIIHPENSGEWLQYMFEQLLKVSPEDTKRPQIIAFFTGVMTHYAADLYGHDYVNEWARGWFPSISEILANTEKAKIIIRHILVETYMDQKVPANENLSLKIPTNFIKECYTDKNCLKRYPKDDNKNLLSYMGNLSNNVHEKSQDNSIAMLDIFNYYSSWDKDVSNGITEWINTWNKVAVDTMSEGGMTKAKEHITEWFSTYFLKMTFLPTFLMDIIKKIGEIIDYLNILKPIKEMLLKMFTDIAIQLVYAATGIRVSDIKEALKEIEKMFKDPKLYLNNGILYSEKNITDQLDRDFGNYGTSRDTLNQSFEAFYNCLNMAKLCILGPENLNKLAALSGSAFTTFENKRCISTIRNITITIKTSSDWFSGTDDNVYFAVLTKDNKVYEILMDKAGYNDFEAGDLDSYNFELPESVQLSQISAFRLRKDYINISDDWKPQWIKITDVNTQKLIYEQNINTFIKDRTPYVMNVNLKDSDKIIEIDPSIISFMYSLDAKGLGSENPTQDKQWAHDGFLFYGNVDLRKKLMVPIFKLSASQYAASIFNDYTLAMGKAKVTQINVKSGYIVDSIQLVYDDKFSTPIHGGGGGDLHTLTLAKDEYIVEISGSIGEYEYCVNFDTIGKLTIKTSKGQSISYGEERAFRKKWDFNCKAPAGEQIFALAGKYLRTDALDNSFLSKLDIGMTKPIG